jgi:hypothetical protein
VYKSSYGDQPTFGRVHLPSIVAPRALIQLADEVPLEISARQTLSLSHCMTISRRRVSSTSARLGHVIRPRPSSAVLSGSIAQHTIHRPAGPLLAERLSHLLGIELLKVASTAAGFDCLVRHADVRAADVATTRLRADPGPLNREEHAMAEGRPPEGEPRGWISPRK